MSKVYILLADGFEDIEAIAPYDILKRASNCVSFVSITENKSVVSSHLLKLQCDLNCNDDLNEADLLVLPGGMPGAKNLSESSFVLNLIEKFYNEKKIISAICATPAVVLSKFDFMKGIKATSFPTFKDSFSEIVDYVDEDVVVDKNIVTGRASGSSIAFGLKLVEILNGIDAKNKVIESMGL